MSSASTFGQNAWLVDEMFQQFQKDPKSVDKEWRELFEAQGDQMLPPLQQKHSLQRPRSLRNQHQRLPLQPRQHRA
ncbi:hypothetical protein KaCgl_28920 [Corynebacterium glutamicum]|nr:hypothetical protein KaCgl_28920 [Corynebacterium glutamicum]